MTQPIHPMLERVARSIAKIDHNGRVAEEGYWANPDTGCNLYRHMARAAIHALLEPDEGMEQAWQDAEDWEDHPVEAYLNIRRYQAMLKPLLGDEGALPQSEEKPQPVPGVYGPEHHAAGFVAKVAPDSGVEV